MKKLATALSALALTGVMAIPAPATAQSVSVQFGARDRFIAQSCDGNWRDRDCRDWRDNRRNWNRSNYDRWYQRRGVGLGNFAAGVFGFALGAAIAGSDRGGRVSGHVARCEAQFRSYNRNTDMYLGYDGDYHRCNL